jgi:hypothetical protein
MLKIKYNDFLNEELAMVSRQKLRDSIHDIIINLKKGEKITIEELSKLLLSEYKITISPYFLDLFLDEFIKAKKGLKSNTFFTREDTKWLGVREIKGTKEVRNNLLYLKPNLSKHKRKLIIDDEKNKFNKDFDKNYYKLKINPDIIKKSLILQKPNDYIDILKNIYDLILIKKKYENTPENCWKLMMIIGKENKLDRYRGWFKIAPKSIKDMYAEEGRIDYTLEPY